MAHIVVVGGGTGGMPAAYELKEELGEGHDITLINEKDYFQFVPSNPWIGVGWRERSDITISIEKYVSKKGIKFIAGRVDNIDPKENSLTMENGDSINYDYLVIATGPKLYFEEVEGSGPEGFTHSVCSVDHAEAFYEDYKKLIEKGSGHIVIGAMPFASCFGPAYEFAFIVDTDLKRRKIRDKFHITLVTSEPLLATWV